MKSNLRLIGLRPKAALFDTHVHFDGLLEGTDEQSVLDRALAQGVDKIIAIGGSPEANRLALDISLAHPMRVMAAIGYARDLADQEYRLSELASLLQYPGIAAIGETGLDFYYDRRTKEAQLILFQRMLELAREYQLPVIVHSREAEDATISLLKDHVRTWPGPSHRLGVLHCFTGGLKFARHLLDLGFFISLSGVLTFRNARELRDVAGMIPDERILIETDSPWLAPEPCRGKRNEPANLRFVAEVLADIRHCSFETIASLTTQNAEKLFSFTVFRL